MRTTGVRAAIIGVAVVGAAVTAANADFTVFATRASWEAAVSPGFTEENFSGGSLNQSLGSFTFQGAGHINNVGGAAGQVNSRFEDRIIPGSTTTWSFSSAIKGWGGNFDFNPGGAGTGLSVTAYLLLNGTLVGNITNPGPAFNGFWGFTSTTLFDQVVLGEGPQPAAAETYNMDNMVMAPTLIPLPPAVWAGLAGLGMVYGVRRFRKA